MKLTTTKDPVTEIEIRKAFEGLNRLSSMFHDAEDVEKMIQRLAFEREQLLSTLRDIDHTTTCKQTRLKIQTLVRTVYRDI